MMNAAKKIMQSNFLHFKIPDQFRTVYNKLTSLSFLSMILMLPVVIYVCSCGSNREEKKTVTETELLWWGPNKFELPENDAMVRYGHGLLAKTSYYLGPKGTVAQITNGMNCQNCHLYAGTIPWGNNYGAVAATYPKFRGRSGSNETIVKRVNDCLQRSLNGSTLDSNSKEMLAIMAYMNWVGKDVPKGHSPKGSGIMALPFLDRAADSVHGKVVFINNCQRCHGADGQGQKNLEGNGYIYPPLWGDNSYTTAAGLYRLSKFAGFVKANMPFEEVNYHNPLLTDEEAWDVAAFVNSQPRPSKYFKEDWPDISKKPIDHPFGPFDDSFSEEQHKYGPYKPIQIAKAALAKKNADQ